MTNNYRILVHRLGRAPAAYHHGRRRRHRSRHDGAYYPLSHQQHRHAAGANLMSRLTSRLACPPRCCRRGDVGYRTAPPPPPPPSPPSPTFPHLHRLHCPRTHYDTYTHSRFLASPSSARPSSARPWYPFNLM
jgi:hypothetical protein